MGAGRWTIARQLLTESGALAVIGGTLGLGLAVGGIDVLRAVAPDILPRMEAIRVDSTVLAFTLALSLATGLVFGLVPALQTSGLDLNGALKYGGRGTVGAPGHQRFRNSLVVAQVTLGLVLLVGAGLTIRSLDRLGRVEPGFNPDDALAVPLELTSASGPAREFARRAVAEIAGLPGVHHYGLAADVSAQVYEPFDQLPFSFVSLVVRSSSNPEALAPAVRQRIRTVDPNQPVSRIVPYATLTRASIGGQRFLALLLGTFGGVALSLAAVGIYGVMAYSVSQRTHEIGLRMALGADRRSVLRLVVLGGMRLSAFGIVLGLAAALTLSRVLAGTMTGLLFETSTLDPLTFVAAPLALGAAALIACYVPARRAARVDPMVSLRWE